jgi:hypothetical protein
MVPLKDLRGWSLDSISSWSCLISQEDSFGNIACGNRDKAEAGEEEMLRRSLKRDASKVERQRWVSVLELVSVCVKISSKLWRRRIAKNKNHLNGQ